MPAQVVIHDLALVEFGVGLDDDNGERYLLIPVDADVRAALREMVMLSCAALAARLKRPSPLRLGTGPPFDPICSGEVRLLGAAKSPVDLLALETPTHHDR
jgi:hypothetical protein